MSTTRGSREGLPNSGREPPESTSGGSEHSTTVAALVIGTELLTGKVQEQNINLVAKELFSLGVELKRVVLCRDDPATIAAEVNALRQRSAERHHIAPITQSSGGGDALQSLGCRKASFFLSPSASA